MIAQLKKWVGGVALAAACATATAGMHQICFEGPLVASGSTPTGIFGCTIDGGGSCKITGLSGNMFASSHVFQLKSGVQAGIGTFSYFDFQTNGGVGTFSAKVEFFDTNSVKLAERRCTVTAGGAFLGVPGNATGSSVLTGFTTDASGLVTTGVWKFVSPLMTNWNTVFVTAPGDFVVVGGGATGVETPTGALVVASTPGAVLGANDRRTWLARTSEGGGATQVHQTTGFVIGMHIEGMTAADLAAAVQRGYGSATTTANPTLSIAPPSTNSFGASSIIVGGGMETVTTVQPVAGMGWGQFATANAPTLGTLALCTGVAPCSLATGATSWYAESKDQIISDPGSILGQVLWLPPTITVAGVTWQVVPNAVSATSGSAAHPAIDVSGLRGDYALTSIGAVVNWHHLFAMGNLLWRLEPRAELGGASVASKDHVLSSLASITGFALGIKLAPMPAPIKLQFP